MRNQSLVPSIQVTTLQMWWHMILISRAGEAGFWVPGLVLRMQENWAECLQVVEAWPVYQYLRKASPKRRALVWCFLFLRRDTFRLGWPET